MEEKKPVGFTRYPIARANTSSRGIKIRALSLFLSTGFRTRKLRPAIRKSFGKLNSI